jgi:hypothetical protein
MLDRDLNDEIAAIRAGKTIQNRLSMSRFWFHIKDGDPRYLEGENIVMLDGCQVVLLTERQMARADGKLIDAGGRDPGAKALADDFTRLYRRTARTFPHYADLENIYRLRAIIQMMFFQGALQKAGMDIRFFLNEYRYLEESFMPGFRRGLYNKKERKINTGSSTVWLFPMTCGGVSMAFQVTSKRVRRDRTDGMSSLHSRATVSRPSRDAIFWMLPKTAR